MGAQVFLHSGRSLYSVPTVVAVSAYSSTSLFIVVAAYSVSIVVSYSVSIVVTYSVSIVVDYSDSIVQTF